MWKLLVLFIPLSFWFSLASAQQKQFDSIYQKTITETIYKDPAKALKNVENLIEIAPEENNLVRTLLLKAEILRMAGLRHEAIQVLLEADSITKNSNPQFQIIIHGLLATNHRENKAPRASVKHLEIAQNLILTLDNFQEKHKRLANVYQEIAYAKREQQDYRGAIESIKKSTENLVKVARNNADIPFGLALNYQIMGENFLSLKQIDSAEYYLNQGMLHLERSNSPESSLKGFIVNGLAKSLVQKKEYDRAKELFSSALEIAEKSQNHSLLKEVYLPLIALYKDMEDHEGYIANNEKYLQLLKEERSTQKEMGDKMLAVLNPSSDTAYARKYLLGITLLGGTLIIVFFVFLISTKSKRNAAIKTAPVPGIENSIQGTQKEYMSDETINNIIKKLKKLEEEKFYLNKDLSLASVAAEVGVNHRYLSHSIRHAHHKDFTSYINDLRIKYIIEFLNEDPKHLNYKISYLAQVAGFTSHNRFSLIFKKCTGKNPSELIASLQLETIPEEE